MSNVRRLVPAEDEYRTLIRLDRRAHEVPTRHAHAWCDSDVIAELLRDLLEVVELRRSAGNRTTTDARRDIRGLWWPRCAGALNFR